jgi:hypothetical protein
MAVQTRLDTYIKKLLLNGESFVQDSVVFAQNAGATVDVVNYTVIAKNPATGQWVPLTDVADVNGLGVPRGIYVGDTIPAADLVAGTVTGKSAVVGGAGLTVDRNLLVFEGAIVALSDEITADNKTVEDAFREIGIFPESVEYVDQTENA